MIRKYPELETRTAVELVKEAHEAFLAWRDTSFAERAEPMRRAATVLENRSREWGELMAREMGKPVSDGVGEAEKCAWVCRYYADHAEDFLAPVHASTDALESYWTHRPLGVVLAIMPWNFPFWQVFRFVAPGLMAGNAAVLKHASNVPGCALAIEEILREAGFPGNLFRTLLIGHVTTDALLEHPLVAAATVTGSVSAGRSVAEKAGGHLKKTVLELGGSDPYVVLADADLERAAEACATSRLINSGQSCIAAKRFVVVEEVYDAWLERFVDRMESATPGDPMDDDTRVGPQAREDLRDDLHGPVAAVIRAEDEEDAIRIANDTPFGLGAAVPRLPFGGIRESGYGRELGPHGIREFVNVKTVWVER